MEDSTTNETRVDILRVLASSVYYVVLFIITLHSRTKFKHVIIDASRTIVFFCGGCRPTLEHELDQAVDESGSRIDKTHLRNNNNVADKRAGSRQIVCMSYLEEVIKADTPLRGTWTIEWLPCDTRLYSLLRRSENEEAVCKRRQLTRRYFN
ncbi:hypothetical protein EDC96DRAFT_544697 [Choanephora cucurbitarum]|nr:hypothetical protein EDC96DRAFT_544697 [Choanephora cucurbitarum]